jgi:hypothetical protein
MADRNFTEFRYSLEKKVVDLYATCAMSGSGAGALTYAKGIVSIAKDGQTAGQYIVTLKDPYKRLLGVDITFQDGSAVPLTCFHYVKAETVATTKLITLVFAIADKTPTDPAATSILKLKISLSNSSAL